MSIAKKTAMTLLAGCLVITGGLALAFWDESEEPVVKKDVPFVPTPEDVVVEMLRLAQIDSSDLLYDLGSGDGRIVIAAAKQYGARGIGIDIDPQRIRESNENAHKEGVTDRVQFIRGNLFETDLRPATAVTMYLLPRVNLQLRPKLLSELRPGTPVVSHAFDMAEWQPDQNVSVNGRRVYLWIIPADVNGAWRCELKGGVSQGPAKGQPCSLDFSQTFQMLNGSLSLGGKPFPLEEARLSGDRLSFTVTQDRGGRAVKSHFTGRVEGDAIRGSMHSDGSQGEVAWSAQRLSHETHQAQAPRPAQAHP